MWYYSIIKWNLRNLIIWEHISKCIWFFNILKLIHMLLNLKQVIVLIHCYRSVLKIFVMVIIIHN